MNPIGIMQGRLSPPAGNRIQSFPIKTWRHEFTLARVAGFDSIEWVYEKETEAENPIRSDDGIEEIRRRIEETGVKVFSICADYFMRERLVDRKGSPRERAVKHLLWLIGRAGLLGVRYLLLPFVDEASLCSSKEVKGLKLLLRTVLKAAERARVELHLETDFAPQELNLLLRTMDYPLLRANYDIGNSAALGRDPSEELPLLLAWLGSVHVKDRLLGGGSVPLGTGSADFATCFQIISSAGYRGPFVLQTAREEGLSELELAIRNRRFVEVNLNRLTKAEADVAGV